ncbi:MAG: transketolase [Deltaproteobacteria bacterium]
MKDKLKAISNNIRTLSIDAIQKANSGHPGLPLGMADVATVLFGEFLRFNPQNPDWINRDRFVLSGGHGSMLLYSLLHLFGFDVSLEDIKAFRQWGSKTPGHPEFRHTPGVETTTGPLGQGIANGVGMAIAEAHIAAAINTKKHNIINHRTYVFAGDGDMMEGLSHEACSLAGHLKLNKLIVFYDQNNITIDGNIDLACSDDVKKRFKSYGWRVLEIDGHCFKQVRKAIVKAKKEKERPSLIICKTTIGFGSPNKAGTNHVHGSPLGKEEVRLTKENLGSTTEDFYVNEEVREFCNLYIESKMLKYDRWLRKFDTFKKIEKERYKFLNVLINKEIDHSNLNPTNYKFPAAIATRAASEIVLNSIFAKIPGLIGGSADLTPSNNTMPKICETFTANKRNGRYIHYGIREHAMASVMNGLAVYGGIIPYGGTFLVFSDYMRPAVRMAALMGIQTIFIFTHDSIGLGEDGPTHQPVEHISSLSLIPNVVNFRPMDAYETVVGWKIALKRKNGPTNLILSRQNLTVYKRGKGGMNNVSGAEKGAYVILDDENFEAIIIASGSEVELAVEAKAILNQKGIKVRLISMPSKEIFEMQSRQYKEKIMPESIENRVFIEAGVTAVNRKYAGVKGVVIGIDKFGASAPYKKLYEEYGLNSSIVVKTVLDLIRKSKKSN